MNKVKVIENTVVGVAFYTCLIADGYFSLFF